eukprot:1897935-Rhodomonas_salina.1
MHSSYVPLQLLEAEKVKNSFVEGEADVLRSDLDAVTKELEDEKTKHAATLKQLEEEKRNNADLREEFQRFKVTKMPPSNNHHFSQPRHFSRTFMAAASLRARIFQRREGDAQQTILRDQEGTWSRSRKSSRYPASSERAQQYLVLKSGMPLPGGTKGDFRSGTVADVALRLVMRTQVLTNKLSCCQHKDKPVS